ncbi:MAG: hypothetical protein H6976_12655 [Gammaproteobacteria bacterium]|nr:hypothetical protein [Gammaproteobacteria bacterium]
MKGFNYKHNDLFRRGPQTRLNACIGTNGGPYDFSDYSRGYFQSAKNQLDAIIKNSGLVDILIYPLCYSYRHGIELGLKHLARELPLIFQEGEKIKLTHNLNDNWNSIRPYIVRLRRYLDENNESVPFIDKVLNDFLEFDPNGEVFRFPENRKGDLHLQEARIINVEVLGAYMERLAEIFKYWFYKSRDLYEIRDEIDF